ncbi:MAG: hypothetical protein WC634_00200 [archaeon]
MPLKPIKPIDRRSVKNPLDRRTGKDRRVRDIGFEYAITSPHPEDAIYGITERRSGKDRRKKS